MGVGGGWLKGGVWGGGEGLGCVCGVDCWQFIRKVTTHKSFLNSCTLIKNKNILHCQKLSR